MKKRKKRRKKKDLVLEVDAHALGEHVHRGLGAAVGVEPPRAVVGDRGHPGRDDGHLAKDESKEW